MEDESILCVSRLRARAAKCRELARAAHSRGIACELESVAADYERDADRLEEYRATSFRSALLPALA